MHQQRLIGPSRTDRPSVLLPLLELVIVGLLASPAHAENAPGLRWIGAGSGGSGTIAFGPSFDPVPSAGGGTVRLTTSGPGLSFGAALDLGHDFFVEWDGEISLVDGSRTITRSAPSTGAFSITSQSVPTGTISVDTSPSTSPAGAGAKIVATAPGQGGSTVTISSTNVSPSSPAGNTISVYAFSPTLNGGAFVSAVLKGDSQTSAAYGLIYDQTGFALTGLGGAGLTSVTTELHDSTDAVDQRLLLGRGISVGSGWTLTPKFGLDLLHTDRTIAQNVLYRQDLGVAGVTNPPSVSLGQTERLRSTYVTMLLGTSANRPLGNGWTMSLSADLGRGRVTGHYSSSTSVTVTGVATQSMQGASSGYEAMTWISHIGVGFSRPVAPDTTFFVGVSGGYLSAVPSVTTVARSSSPAGSGGTSVANLNGSGQVEYVRGVVTHPQFSATISASLVWRF